MHETSERIPPSVRGYGTALPSTPASPPQLEPQRLSSAAFHHDVLALLEARARLLEPPSARGLARP